MGDDDVFADVPIDRSRMHGYAPEPEWNPPPPRCQEMISDPPWYVHQRRCTRKGVVDMEMWPGGVKIYCKQHAAIVEKHGFGKRVEEDA